MARFDFTDTEWAFDRAVAANAAGAPRPLWQNPHTFDSLYGGPAVAAGKVWGEAESSDSTSGSTVILSALDPATGRPLGQFPLPGGNSVLDFLAASHDSLYFISKAQKVSAYG